MNQKEQCISEISTTVRHLHDQHFPPHIILEALAHVLAQTAETNFLASHPES